MKVLPAIHTSPETAYVVEDYPYGFRLRCMMRTWVEHKKGHGYRVVSQTSNPKRGGWNTPKAGTYSPTCKALYLDENGHLQNTGIHFAYISDMLKLEAFRNEFDGGIYGVEGLDAFLAKHSPSLA